MNVIEKQERKSTISKNSTQRKAEFVEEGNEIQHKLLIGIGQLALLSSNERVVTSSGQIKWHELRLVAGPVERDNPARVSAAGKISASSLAAGKVSACAREEDRLHVASS